MSELAWYAIETAYRAINAACKQVERMGGKTWQMYMMLFASIKNIDRTEMTTL